MRRQNRVAQGTAHVSSSRVGRTARPYLKAGMECLMISVSRSWGNASLPGHVARSSIPSKADDRNTCTEGMHQAEGR